MLNAPAVKPLDIETEYVIVHITAIKPYQQFGHSSKG